ncbi:MAG: MerR family transcriptional regulator [Muribaculaceae bacterium]|nr:MerR family transcriptional regulator [Muribaculaceae bacterium]MDE5660510.1 MerR family transcriptional regulator [Muribaculaceae bacterium]MDE6367530.1 MerR family transcriptional regulator [Muribaculaceae bacterium]
MKELTKSYYRIREVSEILGEPASTLRYWESVFPQLRVKRNEKGTRYYTPENIAMLRQIRYLLCDRGLKIEAAAEQMRVSADSVAAKQRAIERLQNVREVLVGLRDALHRFR